MLIQCTKKLLDEIKVKPEQEIVEDDLFSWHANIITVNRKKTVVMVNDKNRYAIVFYGLKAKDFKQLDKLLLEGIRETFEAEKIKEEVIELYLKNSGVVSFSKTKNRTCVARMNRACETVQYWDTRLDPEKLIQTDISMRLSKLLAGEGKGYIHPNEEMYKDLEEFAGQPIFSSVAVQLNVRLNLNKHQVWRKIVVPLDKTFYELHEIIQTTFGWKNYHLHDFTIYGEGKEPMDKIICIESVLDYDFNDSWKLDTDVQLADYIPKYTTLLYRYDFGDNWEHIISVEEIIEDYFLNYSMCLEGEGATPPEDIGGEPGYEEYLTILKNPTHNYFKNINQVASIQKYNAFDIERVNRLLKRV